MKKLLKNKKGMTLTELLTGTLIFTLITAVAVIMLMSILSVYTRANDIAEFNTLLDSIANRIINDLSASTAAPQYDSAIPEITIFVGSAIIEYAVDTEGVLCRNGSPVLPKEYYRGKSVYIDCPPPDSGATFTLIVTISSDEGGTAVSRGYTIKPLALNQY